VGGLAHGAPSEPVPVDGTEQREDRCAAVRELQEGGTSEPCPELEPLVWLFPAVVPWVPPINPIRASTWHRTVVFWALSIDPFSTT